MSFLKGLFTGAQGMGENVSRALMMRRQKEIEDARRAEERGWKVDDMAREDTKEEQRRKRALMQTAYQAAVQDGDVETMVRLGNEIGLDPAFLTQQANTLKAKSVADMAPNLDTVMHINKLAEGNPELLERIMPDFKQKIRTGQQAFTNQQIADQENMRIEQKGDDRYNRNVAWQEGQAKTAEQRYNDSIAYRNLKDVEEARNKEREKYLQIGSPEAIKKLNDNFPDYFGSPELYEAYIKNAQDKETYKHSQMARGSQDQRIKIANALPEMKIRLEIMKKDLQDTDENSPEYLAKLAEVASYEGLVTELEQSLTGSPVSRIMGESKGGRLSDEELAAELGTTQTASPDTSMGGQGNGAASRIVPSQSGGLLDNAQSSAAKNRASLITSEDIGSAVGSVGDWIGSRSMQSPPSDLASLEQRLAEMTNQLAMAQATGDSSQASQLALAIKTIQQQIAWKRR